MGDMQVPCLPIPGVCLFFPFFLPSLGDEAYQTLSVQHNANAVGGDTGGQDTRKRIGEEELFLEHLAGTTSRFEGLVFPASEG